MIVAGFVMDITRFGDRKMSLTVFALIFITFGKYLRRFLLASCVPLCLTLAGCQLCAQL